MENMALEFPGFHPFPSFFRRSEPFRGTGGQIAICLGIFSSVKSLSPGQFYIDPLQPSKNVWQILAGLYLPANDI